eukprot:GILI01017862.1.p1 GENE.GILI01017862.1~~GILI01017862.1.p1  ORF type:complete len:127 (+),score=32.17 GILI01017862.1:325-705(+)
MYAPSVIVEGSEYPAPAANRLIASILGYVQFGLFALILFGDKIKPYLPFQVPQPLMEHLESNKLSSLAMCFFLFNMINNMLISSGAFEITYGDHVIFSKLASGRMPSLNEILEGLQAVGVRVTMPV